MGILRKSHKQVQQEVYPPARPLSRSALPASAWGSDVARIDARQQEFAASSLVARNGEDRVGPSASL